MHSLLQLFSVPLRQRLATLPKHVIQELQEIRVREERPLEIAWGRSYGFISRQSGICDDPSLAYIPTREDCAILLEMLTMHSLYTFEEELRRGYITVTGGHRVGLSGRAVLEQGRVKHLKDITGFNIRIANERKGAAIKVLPYLTVQLPGQQTIHHTLIVSPPQQGKTTLIRDLARILSGGPASAAEGWLDRAYKVGIVDERSEIAACFQGIPRFDLGPRTDVLDACPKAEGMMMMIRSMSPEVLVVDEIGRVEDAEAIHEAVHAGIKVIATAHGLDHADVQRRPVLQGLLAEGVFGRTVVLGNRHGAGTLMGVYDARGRPVSPPAQPAELAESPKPPKPIGASQASWKEERGSPTAAIDWTGNPILLRGELPLRRGESLC